MFPCGGDLCEGSSAAISGGDFDLLDRILHYISLDSGWLCPVEDIRGQERCWGWHYVWAMKNPPDLVTRGISGVELVASEFWLPGPDLIRGEEIPGFDSMVLVCHCPLVNEEFSKSEPETV